MAAATMFSGVQQRHWHYAFIASGAAVFVGAMASYAVVVEVALLIWVVGSIAGLVLAARQAARLQLEARMVAAPAPSRRPGRH